MDVPSPSVAEVISAQLAQLAVDVSDAGIEVAAVRGHLAAGWRGHAAAAADQLLGLVDVLATDTAEALRQASGSWADTAGDLRWVHRLVDVERVASAALDAWTLVSAAQAGLDIFTDVGAATAGTAEQSALATLRAGVRIVVDKAVARVAKDKARLLSVRAIGSYVGGGLALGALQQGTAVVGSRYAFTGRFGLGGVLTPSLVTSLVPTKLSRAGGGLGLLWDPAIPATPPPAFVDAERYHAAVVVADNWAAADTRRALVAVRAAPDGGVRLLVRGGGTADHLSRGRPYTADQLDTLPDLAAVLDRISALAGGAPVTVVVT